MCKQYSSLGINHPRVTSVTGNPLPSARLVSAMSHPDISHLHGRYTLMLMQFAQVLDHDITFTPVHKGKCRLFLILRNILITTKY